MSCSKWEIEPEVDIINGEYVTFKGKLFKVYYDGCGTFTLMSGKRMIFCNRHHFTKVNNETKPNIHILRDTSAIAG